MKTRNILTILAAFSLMAGAVGADDGTHRVKILKLESLVQQTPRFQVAGIKDKRLDPRHWLELEAELEVETTSKSKFIPAITAHWFAVVIDKVTRKPVRLTGKIEFINVRTHDRKIHISAYIGPDVLEKLTGENKPGENDIEGIALKIDGNGIVKTKKYAKDLVMVTKEERAQWWEKWENKTISNGITAKSKTPFAPLWTDRYPAEKLDD